MKNVLCFFVGIFFSCVGFASSCTPQSCMIVIDAGSTGSRAYLYQYQFDKKNTPVLIKSISSQKVVPGLAKLDSSADVVNQYLNRLLADINTQQNQGLPVYLYATAGMRLVPIEQQQALYGLIGGWFKSQPNFELKEAKTITGKDEGAYGWLAVNYLAGIFSEPQHANLGVMDFGGASIQIALSIDEQQLANIKKEDLTTVQFSGIKYHIYSKSYLGLGLTEITKQFLTDQTCFARNYPLPTELVGLGDVFQCELDVENLTNLVHKVDEIKGLNIIEKTTSWVALGALGYLHNTKPFESLGSSFNLKDVLALAQNGVCRVDWQDVREKDPNNPYLYRSCLASAYYYAIAVQGYGLSEETIINTELPGAKGVPDWTIGVVMMKHQ